MPFTVEIDWLGRTFIFEDVPGEVSETVDFFGDVFPAPRSFPMVARFETVDVPQQMVRGSGLDSAFGRVMLDGKTLLSGRIQAPEWRGNRPVRFSIQEDPWQTAQYPPDAETRRIKGDTTGARTSLYPTVFGQPGGGVVAGTPGRFGKLFNNGSNVLLVAGHPVDAGSIRVYVQRADTDELWWEADTTTATVTDDNGRTITIALEPDNPDSVKARFGTDWLVGWPDGSGLDGRAGVVLQELLQQLPYRLDSGLIASYLSRLNAYQIDSYIIEPVDVLEYIASVLEHMPASIVQGRSGMYIWVWDPDTKPLAEWFVGDADHVTGVVAASDLRYADAPPLQSVTMLYRQDAITEDYAESIEGQGLYAELARRKSYGEVLTIEAPHIATTATARRCVDLMLRARGRAPIVLDLDVDRAVLGSLRAGDCITLSWSSEALSGHHGWITSITETGQPTLAVQVTIPFDPLRHP